jgi:uncharacterized OB-fold protein
MTDKTEPPITRPAPVMTPDTVFYWEGAARGELLAQQCGGCGTLHHPPRPMCPRCGSTERHAKKLSGRGTVYSWVVPRHPVLPIFAPDTVVALVELEEGIRIVSNVYGVPVAEMRNGIEVEAYFVPTAKGGAVPVFRPRSV